MKDLGISDPSPPPLLPSVVRIAFFALTMSCRVRGFYRPILLFDCIQDTVNRPSILRFDFLSCVERYLFG